MTRHESAPRRVLRSRFGIGASVAVLLLATWLLWPDGSEYAAARDSGSPETHVGTEAKHESDTMAAEGSVAERSALASGMLRLRVTRVDGEVSRGVVYCRFSQSAPRTSSLLAPEHGFPIPARGVTRVEHGGRASIRVPGGSWTWLRATSTRASFLAGYALVPPFEGEHRVELLLGKAKRGIHAFVVESDLRTPATNSPVRVFHTAMDAPGLPRLIRRARTDAYGYLRLAELEPGGFLLCADGADPGDGEPYVRRVLLPRQVAMQQTACTLVVPDKRLPLTLRATVVGSKWKGEGPKLYLRRLEGHRGQLFPMQGVLKPGEQDLRLEVPAGSYEVGVMPLGFLRFATDARRIDVRADRENRCVLGLESRRPDARVELVGLGSGDFPVTVYARKLDELCDPSSELLFVGPYKWHLSEMDVRGTDYPCHLIATGRLGCWISRSTLPTLVGRVRVSMRPPRA